MTELERIADVEELVRHLRNARVFVNYGNGDVRDEPDELHEAAADALERIARERDEARERASTFYADVEAYSNRAEAADARIIELESARKPFVEGTAVGADFRRARAILKGEQP
jgi:hypothetical protein